MRIYFGLNTMLKLTVIDEQVGHVQEIYLNVHMIEKDPPAVSGILLDLYCDYHGERIHFNNFNQIAFMNKRKLLALRNITAILS